MRYTLEDNGFRDIKGCKSENNKTNKDYKINTGKWTLFWSVGPIKKAFYETLKKYQKVNHFPASHNMTRKDLMYRQVSKLQEIHGNKHFGFLPKTYILPNEYAFLEESMKSDP